MAVWSEVEYQFCRRQNRLDAEFYQPAFLRNDASLNAKKARPLSYYIEDIRYGLNVPPVYTNDGLPFYRALNLKEYGIDGDLLRIPYDEDTVGSGNILKEGDILIVRSGANVGDTGIIYGEMQGGTFGSYTIRIRVSGIDPFYLYAFLKSHYGRLQTLRFRSGAAQPNMSMPNLQQLLVFAPSTSQAQEMIRQQVLASHRKRKQSETLYAQAEGLLLSDMGLGDLDLSPTLFYEGSYSETLKASRLDAEIFSPRILRIIATLSQGGLTLSHVAKLAKRHFKAKAGVPFQYIEIGDVGCLGDVVSKEVAGEDAPSRAAWIVKPGDVLTTTVRPIRRLTAIVSENQEDFVCSSGFAVLQPSNIEAEVLLTYLRLPLIAELLDLHTTASMYPAISTTDLLRIPFKMPNDTVRGEVVDLVRGSFKTRNESRRLLDDAKRMVEEAVLGGGS